MSAGRVATFRAGFAIEQTLGHVTYGQNLRRHLADEPGMVSQWLDVPFRPPGRLYGLPPLSLNWSLRAGVFLRRHLDEARWLNLDAAFLHTATIALLSDSFARRVPTVISVDATPMNIDSLAAGYTHARQPEAVERLKRRLVRRALSFARGYVSWSEWAKDSLVRDYGVERENVLVVAPGTDLELFARPRVRRKGPPRILFVGGDFVRKGGDLLLQAYQRRLRDKAELHLVTSRAVEAQAGVFSYAGLRPNSPQLLNLFHTADIFALPTRADCLAVVLGEAMAASLPVVTTNVGAHEEAVSHGVNGLIVEPGSLEQLTDALERLVDDVPLRLEMGTESRRIAEERFDGRKNAQRVAAHMKAVAGG